jgi:DNA-binding phage protein
LPAWNAYESKVKEQAQVSAQMRQAMQEQAGDAQALADQRVAMMKQRAQAAEEVNSLRKSLVAALSPEQKATFEQYAMGPHFAGGPGGGAQRGYGPGPSGGRGAGFGRSCIGAA